MQTTPACPRSDTALEEKQNDRRNLKKNSDGFMKKTPKSVLPPGQPDSGGCPLEAAGLTQYPGSPGEGLASACSSSQALKL